jgi:hypothetical protein
VFIEVFCISKRVAKRDTTPELSWIDTETEQEETEETEIFKVVAKAI